MLRVSKLNIAEHDGVWHHSFCTCLYRAGTDASFFPHGGAIPHCILPYISLNYIKQLWNSFLGKSLEMGLYLVLPWNCYQPFIFHPISSMFFSCPSKELPMASDGLAWEGVRKGKKRLVVTCFVMFCPVSGIGLWMLPAFFWGVPGISNTPRINSPWGNPKEWHSAWLSLGSVPNLSFFPLFLPPSIFFSARSIWLRLFFSCFVLFLGWLGGCGSYFFIRRVPDISHTPRIISSLVEIIQNGIQHDYFLEVVPTCPNLSCFPLFHASSFQQEAFGCDCYCHVLSCFCAGWAVAAATFLFEWFQTSHIPLG